MSFFGSLFGYGKKKAKAPKAAESSFSGGEESGARQGIVDRADVENENDGPSSGVGEVIARPKALEPTAPLRGSFAVAGSADGSPGAKDAGKGTWLNAWDDPVAGVRALSMCMRTADLNADGDWRLLVADADKKLKVFKDTRLLSEHALLEHPCALAAYYPDRTRLPALAVAAGANLYIFKNLRPFFRLPVPPLPISEAEASIWAALRDGTTDASQAMEALSILQVDTRSPLSSRSMDLLSLQDRAAQDAYVAGVKHAPLLRPTVITALTTVHKALEEAGSESCLVLGTEGGQVIIMDASGTKIASSHSLPSAPAFLAASGGLDLDWRIVAACRDAAVYTLQSGPEPGPKLSLELESPAVGLELSDRHIVVGCMNGAVHAYVSKTSKAYSLYLPSAPTAMRMGLGPRGARLLFLALASNEVRVYNEKVLVSSFVTSDAVSGLHFGRYGREDHALILSLARGGLVVKLMTRYAKVDATSSVVAPLPEADIPLAVPKKTRLYVEQTAREREQAVDMHRLFQRDLCKMRLATARAYVKVLTDGQGAVSYTTGAAVRLSAAVTGLGPTFKLKLDVQNTGTTALSGVRVLYQWPADVYELAGAAASEVGPPQSNVQGQGATGTHQAFLPAMVPGLLYKTELAVRNIHPQGAADMLRVLVCVGGGSVPVLSANVKMPMSEVYWEN